MIRVYLQDQKFFARNGEEPGMGVGFVMGGWEVLKSL